MAPAIATLVDSGTDPDHRHRAAAAAPDVATQRKQLVDLKAQGILTEEELAAQEARLLT